jgi:conjugative relaxase-like TrwC/TraI family protein
VIRMKQFRTSDSSKRYYTAGLAAGDYYTRDIEQVARWQGEAAKRLGLGEFVDAEQFAALADNFHPGTELSITPRTNDNRTSAYDINFHCPKGLTLLYTMTQDPKILDAFQSSVRETMRDLELQTQTRVRVGGQHRDRETRNLAWGEFIHTTTRPIDGVPDPHLHAHCFVFNFTHDPAEDRFKAAKFRDIQRDMPAHEAAFHARLAKRMRDLGYPTERNAKWWDIAGVPESVIRKFSRRTILVEKTAARLGITDPKQKAELGSTTRDRKSAVLDRREWIKDWANRIDAEERAALRRVIAKQAISRDQPITAREAMDHAIGHRFADMSVVPLPRIRESALRRGVGYLLPDDVAREADSHPELITKREDTQTFATTRTALQEELAIIAFAVDGKNTFVPLERHRRWSVMRGTHLNSDQIAAIHQIMTSPDRVVIVRGGAGTGKTTMMKDAVAAIESRGTAVTIVAPGSNASRNVLRESGLLGADTVNNLLTKPEMQRRLQNGVIWCDEAGQVGSEDMLKICQLAERYNAKVILTGDVKQHAPVGRGDPLRALEQHAGLKPAQMLTVVRQQGQYRTAVEAISVGQLTKGFDILDKMGAIREIEGPDRQARIALDYAEIVGKGRTCIVVSPTHAENDQLSILIRAELRRHEKIGDADIMARCLRDLHWTEAAKRDPANYEAGQIVRFHQSVPGFKPGMTFRVADRDDQGRVWIAALTDDTQRRMLPLRDADRFTVARESQIALAEGDRIRLTGGGYSEDGKKRLNNGAVYRIKGFSERGGLILNHDMVLPRNYGHIAHAYCSTSHTAQSASADVVIGSMPQSALAAASTEQWYVTISRGKQEARIYTDDREALMNAVSESSTRRSAMDLVKNGQVSQPPPQRNRFQEHVERLRHLRAFQSVAQRVSKSRERRQQTQTRNRGINYG